MERENKIIAVCGLKCSECDIFKTTDNPEIAQQIADWFKKEKNKKMEKTNCITRREKDFK